MQPITPVEPVVPVSNQPDKVPKAPKMPSRRLPESPKLEIPKKGLVRYPQIQDTIESAKKEAP